MLRILSIDDSRAVHAYLRDCFAKSTATLSHAQSGKEGLEKLGPNPSEHFDLVLLDWEMPEMTGPEVLQELVKRGNRVPVIMLTSKNEIDDISKMLEIGAQEYIMKPFTPDIIFSKIESVTGENVEKV